MSEQATCHWRDENDPACPCWEVESDCLAGPMGEGYCPECGTRLNGDGTETPMVPVVTSEAVQKTLFHSILRHMARGVLPMLKHSLAAMDLGLCDERAQLTDQGRAILAALAATGQPAPTGPGAEELLRERDLYRAALMHAGGFVWQECQRLMDGSPGEEFDEDLSGEENWFIKFLRDAVTDTRGWADQYLNEATLAKARALLSQASPEAESEATDGTD